MLPLIGNLSLLLLTIGLFLTTVTLRRPARAAALAVAHPTPRADSARHAA